MSLSVLHDIPETLTRPAGPVDNRVVYWQVNLPSSDEVQLALMKAGVNQQPQLVAAATREVADWLDVDEVAAQVIHMSHEINDWIELAIKLLKRLDNVELRLGELGKEPS